MPAKRKCSLYMRESSSAARILLDDVAPFSVAGGRRLRQYQAECARAVIHSVLQNRGSVITVMYARQMGKNETSAQIEAYLLALHARRGGTIVKAAPSFKPQVINSILRLKSALDRNPITRGRWSPQFGYMVALGRASIAFFSADQQANVVGATASLLLEIDEAQGVDPEKYDRDFRPMASSTNATTVLYGTAWSDTSILERQRVLNLEHQARTGERLHFESDWRVLAAMLPAYDRFVRAEIDRLGETHPIVQTQYLLRCLGDAGRLLSLEQLAAIQGSHARQRGPCAGVAYVAGIDLAGADEEAEDAVARGLSPRCDSTVVTIAELTRDAQGNPGAKIVEHVWWTGRSQVDQYQRLLELCLRWDLSRICIDASGIGAGIAAFLASRLGERVEQFVFSAPSKSKLAYGMLAMANTARLQMYADDRSAEWRQWRQEVRSCRYWLRSNEQLAWGVPEREGHDDFVVSLALCCRAASVAAPPAASGLVRAAPPDSGEW